MLPSLGFSEIVLLGILALVVVGPKDLPLLLRKLGRWTAKLRGMAQEFRTGFDELARQAELDELKREVEALRRTASVSELTREITKQLPTLEDYAGLAKTPPPAPALAPSSTEQAPPNVDTGAATKEGPPEAKTASPRQASPQEDSSPVEAEPSPFDGPDHGEVHPIARSAP